MASQNYGIPAIGAAAGSVPSNNTFTNTFTGTPGEGVETDSTGKIEQSLLPCNRAFGAVTIDNVTQTIPSFTWTMLNSINTVYQASPRGNFSATAFTAANGVITVNHKMIVDFYFRTSNNTNPGGGVSIWIKGFDAGNTGIISAPHTYDPSGFNNREGTSVTVPVEPGDYFTFDVYQAGPNPITMGATIFLTAWDIEV